MRAKREVHRLSGYLRVSCVRCATPHKIFSVPLPLPRIPCLNFEQTIAGISISNHFRTVVANSNNFQTHPVCNLLSTNGINPRENIFNNNVMRNGISNIVKSGRFSKYILKRKREAPATLDHAGEGGGVRKYVDILPYNLAQKNCNRLERSTHQSVRFGDKQDSLIGLSVLGGRGADLNLDVPQKFVGIQ